jgi:hypothetical protein
MKSYSKVTASQIEKECMASDESLERYLATVQRIENFFKRFIVKHIERTKNTEADKLVKAATKKVVLPPDVFFQLIKDPSVKTVELEPRMINITQGEDSRAPIMAYLHRQYEPDSGKELVRMHQRAKAYRLIGNDLYKTLVIGPLLCSLSRDESNELLA